MGLPEVQTMRNEAVAVTVPGYQHKSILLPGEVLIRGRGSWNRMTRKEAADMLRRQRWLGSPMRLSWSADGRLAEVLP